MTEFSDYEQNILNKIESHGWFCSSVFDPDGIEPNFSYSVGFPLSLGVPDFIVIGLDHDLMHSMLWEIYQQIEAGKTIKGDTEWSNLLSGNYQCISRKVHPNNNNSDYFNSARWYLKHIGKSENLEFHQIFWPSVTDKLFPWDDNCPTDVIELQPLLYNPIENY